jgi:hypothetical protein
MAAASLCAVEACTAISVALATLVAATVSSSAALAGLASAAIQR